MTDQNKTPLTPDQANDLAAKLWGTLNCDSIHAIPIDVDWQEAFRRDDDTEPRAKIVYPDRSDSSVGELLDLIDEYDTSAREEFEERRQGLDSSDWEELQALYAKALDRAAIANPFDPALTTNEQERHAELQAERADNREDDSDIFDDVLERAQEIDREDPDRWEPMMNCVYPIPRLSCTPEEAQAILDGMGNVIVVLLDGEPHLALSGGGMDMSWDIVRAYLALGFRPPLHFCDLPRMAGSGESDNDRAVMAACIGSAAIAAMWADRSVSHLKGQF